MGDPAGPDLDVVALLDELAARGVEFLVVGGIAAALHGAKRTTRDLDVCPRWTDENLERLATVLKDLGARLRVAGSSEPVEFPIDARSLRVFEVSTWRTRGGDLDVVCGLPTRSGSLAGYDDLIEKAVEHSTSIARVRVASLADIVESKERLGRPPDLEALPELRRLLADD